MIWRLRTVSIQDRLWAFNTVVVAEVRIATIPIVFSVGFVVLMLVTHQIISVKPSWQVTKLMLASGPFPDPA